MRLLPPWLTAAVAALALSSSGLAEGAQVRPPDEDADEEDMQAVRAALQASRPAPQPTPPVALLPALHPTADGLPELGLVAELVASYGTGRARTASWPLSLAELPVELPPGVAPGGTVRLELSLQHVVDGWFRLDVFALAGAGGTSLLEAYATTRALPLRLQLRGGLLLHRFGIENARHPHALSLPVRPVALLRAFGDPGGGGLGLEASFRAPLPWLLEVSAAVLSPLGGEAGRGRELPAGELGLLDLLYVVTLKQAVWPQRGLGVSLGGSAALGPNPTGRANRTDVYGLDAALLWRPTPGLRLGLAAEWLWRRQQVPGGLQQEAGGYCALSAAVRLGGMVLAGAVRYEHLDEAQHPGAASRHRLAAGLDLELGRGSLLRGGGMVDLDPADGGLRGWGGLLGLQLRLGPHGPRGGDAHGLLR
ncbi:MAG: hypothetical protein RMK29_01210 [Myxococcales bacterium]|nr:hypothetical protein [Myxococcota bacterium]MDW8280296.1 hypothetical protein [Myxococcales bacterium]